MNNYTIIKRLDELFEASIFEQPDEDVLESIGDNIPIEFMKQLNYVRKKNAQAKAKLKKSINQKAKEILDKLIEEVGNSNFINSLLAQPKYQKLSTELFSKYENISEQDKESMLKDRRLMDLIKELRKDLENEKDSK